MVEVFEANMAKRDEAGVVSVQTGVFSLLSSLSLAAVMLMSIDLSGWNSLNGELQERAEKWAAEAAKLPSENAAREYLYNETQKASDGGTPLLAEALFPNSSAVEVRVYGDYSALSSPLLQLIRNEGGDFPIEKRALAKRESAQASCGTGATTAAGACSLR